MVDRAVEENAGGIEVELAKFAALDPFAEDALKDRGPALFPGNDRVGRILRGRDVLHDGAMILAFFVERAHDIPRHLDHPFGGRPAAGGDLLELVAEVGDGRSGDGVEDVVFVAEIIIEDAAGDVQSPCDVFGGECLPAALAEEIDPGGTYVVPDGFGHHLPHFLSVSRHESPASWFEG